MWRHMRQQIFSHLQTAFARFIVRVSGGRFRDLCGAMNHHVEAAGCEVVPHLGFIGQIKAAGPPGAGRMLYPELLQSTDDVPAQKSRRSGDGNDHRYIMTIAISCPK